MDGAETTPVEPAAVRARVSELVRQNWEYVCAVAAAFGAGPDAAEDVAQIAFFLLWRAVRQGRVNRAAKPWLRTVARRLAWRHSQQERRRRGDPDEQADAPEHEEIACTPTGEEVLVATEMAAIHEQLLAELTPELREVLVREIRGQSMDDIARDLGIPKTTGYDRLRRARLELDAAWRRLLAREAHAASARRRAALPLFGMWIEEQVRGAAVPPGAPGAGAGRSVRAAARSPLARVGRTAPRLVLLAAALLVLFDTTLRPPPVAGERSSEHEGPASAVAGVAPPREPTVDHEQQRPQDEQALPREEAAPTKRPPASTARAPVPPVSARRGRNLERARILLGTADRMAAEGRADMARGAVRAYDLEEQDNPLPASRAAHGPAAAKGR